jgi:hypothetical protein
MADEGQPGRFAKGDPEPHVRGDRDDGFVEVLDRLDEVGLAEDEVHVLGLIDGDDFDVHGILLSSFGPIIEPRRPGINNDDFALPAN